MSEYLHTSYAPDCDYVDGLVEARSVSGAGRAELQRALAAYLERQSGEWGIRVLSEARVQTSASHVRVADLAVMGAEDEKPERESALSTAPMAVVEILSPGDGVPRHVERLKDFRRMGVKNLWVVDPAARKGFDGSAEEWVETMSFTVPETPVRVDLAALFATLDQDRLR